MVSVYPGSVWGPHDPYCGESCRLLSGVLTNRLPFAIRGGLPIADVRYVAATLAAAVERTGPAGGSWSVATSPDGTSSSRCSGV